MAEMPHEGNGAPRDELDMAQGAGAAAMAGRVLQRRPRVRAPAVHNPFDVKARKLPQDRRAELRSRYMEGDETLTVSSKAKAAIALARDANAVSKLLPPKGPLGYTYFDLKTADDKIQEELLAKNKGKQSKSIHERVDRADKKMKSIALKNASCTCCMTSIGVSKYTVCSNSHYYCEDCIDGLIVHATAPENLDKFKAFEKNVFCSICPSKLHIRALAQGNATDDALDKIVMLRENIAEARGQEFISCSDLRLNIEALFLIKCPTCHKPISDDFADPSNRECAAMKCLDGHAFCGICGMDCSDGAGAPDKVNDAHWHVRHCKYNMNPWEGVGTTMHKDMFVYKEELRAGRQLLYRDRMLDFMKAERVSVETLSKVASDIFAAADFDIWALHAQPRVPGENGANNLLAGDELV